MLYYDGFTNINRIDLETNNKILFTPDDREYYSLENFKINKMENGVYCTFKVKGTRDIDIGLFDRKVNKDGNKIDIYNNNKGRFYEIAIGSYDNTKSMIHPKRGGP